MDANEEGRNGGLLIAFELLQLRRLPSGLTCRRTTG